ncbi:DUF5329 family protein [Caldimonas tepidiphila]|uniref:DUF5329 family protein n=1 Tax=Caldimonas tepidiphila TaxID=2315841 RepID=UPI000E5B68A1|nr:DUF5329 family protein [Caldimonas tepidiphila]
MMGRRAILAASLLIAASLASAHPEGAEARRVERLIDAVAAQRELRFVRNGRAYEPAEAARFLREKLRARGEAVRSAEDFIEQVASRSSTSGRNYTVRHADGRETPAAEFLRAELARIDAAR